jgi:hypothetical protein
MAGWERCSGSLQSCGLKWPALQDLKCEAGKVIHMNRSQMRHMAGHVARHCTPMPSVCATSCAPLLRVRVVDFSVLLLLLVCAALQDTPGYGDDLDIMNHINTTMCAPLLVVCASDSSVRCWYVLVCRTRPAVVMTWTS